MVKNYTKLRAWAWLTFIWSNAQTDLSSEFKEDRNIDENYYFDLGHFWWSLIKPKFNYTQSLLCLPMSQHIDSATRPNQKKTSLAKYRFHKPMSNKGGWHYCSKTCVHFVIVLLRAKHSLRKFWYWLWLVLKQWWAVEFDRNESLGTWLKNL